jgi:cytochrome c oxidase subunit II
MRVRARRLWRCAAVLLGGAFLVTACASDAPQDSLDPKGPVARTIDNLFEPVFWIATGVFVLVEGLLVYALIRFRQRGDEARAVKQIHGNTRLEIIWTILPALLLAGIAVPTIATIVDLSRRPSGDVLDVTVIGKQWWWQIEYPTFDPGVITANEVHIPVDRPVYLTLKSDDVIHSFWVPSLAGKQDLVPGRENTMTIQADEPGVYEGQCAEYCGHSHANMRLRVVAQTSTEFEAWVAEQQQAAVDPPSDLAARGRDLFLNEVFLGGQGCFSCHAVQGTDASAQVGPDLSHFASRQTFAGALLENNEENLRKWLEDPPAVKPGSLMPDYNLSPEEIDALVAYLRSLT